MNYADIAIIAILVLSVLLGIWKGFFKTFSKALTLIIALAIGFILAVELAPKMFPEQLEGPINDLVSKVIINNEYSEGFIFEAGNEWYVLVNGTNAIEIDNALAKMFIPEFLRDPVIASIGGIAAAELATGKVTLAMVVCSAYTHLFEIFLAGTVVFLGSLLVLRIIAKLIYNAVYHKHFLRGVDRFFGGIFRIITGGLFIIILLHIFSVLSGISALRPVIEVIENGQISGPIYNAGILNKIFYGDGLTKLVDILKGVILPALSEAPSEAMLFLASL